MVFLGYRLCIIRSGHYRNIAGGSKNMQETAFAEAKQSTSQKSNMQETALAEAKSI